MADVAIVGGGIIGCSIAFYLRELDRDVVLFERDGLGGETTSTSTAVFASLDMDDGRTLGGQAWNGYKELIEWDNDIFRNMGSLNVAHTERHFSSLDSTARLSENTEVISGDGLSSFGLDPSSCIGGLYNPDSGYIDTDKAIEYWTNKAKKDDVKMETDTEIIDINKQNSTVESLEITDKEIDVDVVVNAGGPWCIEINNMVDVSLPLNHVVGKLLTLDPKEDVSLPYVFFEDGYYFQGRKQNKVYCGHFNMEYSSDKVVDPDRKYSIEDDFYDDIKNKIDNCLPILEGAEFIGEDVGYTTVTPDGKPIVGETSIDGFYVACGMSGYGVTYAPIIGKKIADYIQNNNVLGIENQNLHPSRFS